ncbi:MAG: ABC transporter permease [Bacteroidetes bacterium]|nr:ABC transporter permease [Bacteroidota bacterium]
MPRIYLRELRHIFSDAGVIVLIFAVPFIYPMLYSLIYYPEVVRDMPIAVVDMSHSSDSRKFYRNIDATPELKVAANCNSMEEAVNLFKKREVRGIVQIPETFSHDLANGDQTTISAFADMEFSFIIKQ